MYDRCGLSRQNQAGHAQRGVERSLFQGASAVVSPHWGSGVTAADTPEHPSPDGPHPPARGGQTPAGTFVPARISRRSSSNSEIVRVTTVATGRALRPVASVFDTITTLSM
ncbi:hypothetical protein ACNUDN_00951 [Mycobacterium sp. smrl_JER01]